MSDIEFFGKFDLKPFKSLTAIEREGVEAIKHQKEQARLKAAGKLPIDSEPPETREPFYE